MSFSELPDQSNGDSLQNSFGSGPEQQSLGVNLSFKEASNEDTARLLIVCSAYQILSKNL